MKKGYLAASLVLAIAVASGGASMSANAAISTKTEEVAVFNGDASAQKKCYRANRSTCGNS
jgi:hypothetical protein